MRKRGTILLIVLCLGAISMAQNPIKDLTREILSNNLVLQALEIENQVKLLQDKGELYPDDPEISYAHLWGSPAIIGNKTGLNANQRIKFPTYYSKKKKRNELSADQYTTQLELEINHVIFDALDIMIDLASLSKRKAMLTDRLTRVQQIHDMAERKFQLGEANKIELEKAKLLTDTYRQDFLLLESEERILYLHLQRLNADKAVSVQSLEYEDLATLFSSVNGKQALEGNPVVEIAEMNTLLAEADIKLAKTNLLPDVIVGYTSEAINDEKLAGIQMGISIPLWGKSNLINRAKLKKDLSDKNLALTNQLVQNDWDRYDEMAKQSK